jgi:ABC-type transport system involved in multi-copper enzyme maturation permease subunit
MNLVRAELFKIRTTSLWWIFGLLLIPLWAASILLNWLGEHAVLTSDPNGTGQAADQARAASQPIAVAANLYTSGQYIGILLVLLLSAIVVTNEFFHLTATSTFLVTPRRSRVIGAKFVAAALVALGIWAITTVLDLIFAPLILHQLGVGLQIGAAGVWRAIGLNALAYLLWAVLGVGFGVLIRSQIAATLVLSISYVIGATAVNVVFSLLANNVARWVEKLQVLVPTTASQLMISGTELPGNPPRWVGAVVLIGYAALTGAIGTLLTQRRDIS